MNGSMVTLQSMNLGTPGLEEEHKAPVLDTGVSGVEKDAVEEDKKNDEESGDVVSDAPVGESHSAEAGGRPGIERFVTAQTAALINSVGDDGEERKERPGVERFETAREDLHLVGGEEKKGGIA